MKVNQAVIPAGGSSNAATAHLPVDDPNSPRPRLTTDGAPATGVPLAERMDPQAAIRSSAAAELQERFGNASRILGAPGFYSFSGPNAILKVFKAIGKYETACESSRAPEDEKQRFDEALKRFKTEMGNLFVPDAPLAQLPIEILVSLHRGLTKLGLHEFRNCVEDALKKTTLEKVKSLKDKVVWAGEDPTRRKEAYDNAKFLEQNFELLGPLSKEMKNCAQARLADVWQVMSSKG